MIISQYRVLKIYNGDRKLIEDFVAQEIPLTININNKELVTITCSPAYLKELCAGFLFSSGIINRASDVKLIVIDPERWISNIMLREEYPDPDTVFKRLYTSGCGRGTLFYNVASLSGRKRMHNTFLLDFRAINDLMVSFQKKSEVFEKTGGVHASAIASGNEIITFIEDIGRHNAVDKVVGYMLLNDIFFTDKILLSTGRISSEIIIKAGRARIPCVVSHGAPTDQAIKIAKEQDITLIGFARGTKINVYNGEERVR